MVDRKLTGAHYGLRDWAIQCVTAVITLVYIIILLAVLFTLPKEYSAWQAFFDQTWVKVFTQVSFLVVLSHAWVGIRDLWTDYTKSFGVCLFLQVATITWLVGCLVYSVRVIWG